MKKIFLTVATLIITIISSQAQKQDHADKIEKYRSEKISFLTSKLDLTPAEAQKFWPVYNQLEKEKWEIQKSRRQIDEKIRDAEDSLSETEIIRLTREFAGTMQKEADLMARYNEKLLKLLPAKKVLRLYQAENEFRVHMIKQFRDRHKNGN
jgi:hypothetical protein